MRKLIYLFSGALIAVVSSFAKGAETNPAESITYPIGLLRVSVLNGSRVRWEVALTNTGKQGILVSEDSVGQALAHVHLVDAEGNDWNIAPPVSPLVSGVVNTNAFSALVRAGKREALSFESTGMTSTGATNRPVSLKYVLRGEIQVIELAPSSSTNRVPRKCIGKGQVSVEWPKTQDR